MARDIRDGLNRLLKASFPMATAGFTHGGQLPFHGGIFIFHTEMQLITELRCKGGKLGGSGWERVSNWPIQSCMAGLDLLRRKHYPAPVICHEIQGRVAR